ncbi:DNA-directed RNA polymerase subunit alpha [compost metagenome]
MSSDQSKTVKITVEGLPNMGKVAISHLILGLFNDLGLPAKRMREGEEAKPVIGLTQEWTLGVVQQLKDRGIELEISERQLGVATGTPIVHLDELNIEKKTLHSLLRAGIATTEQLTTMSSHQLSELPGMGSVSLWMIRDALKVHGLKLSPTTLEQI